jgi:hypothetical protein
MKKRRHNGGSRGFCLSASGQVRLPTCPILRRTSGESVGAGPVGIGPQPGGVTPREPRLFSPGRHNRTVPSHAEGTSFEAL